MRETEILRGLHKARFAMRQNNKKFADTDKPFNRLKASIAPLIGHHPCAKIFVILTTA
jgi:hypothetical protein